MRRFKGKYRVDTVRYQQWDYTSTGWYFVTICTQNRVPYFGHIVDEEMRLSSIGEIVAEEWLRTADLRERVDLDAWAIMPNHLHGIVVISELPSGAGDPQDQLEARQRRASTSRLQSGGLGSIVNQFKGACTKRIRSEIDASFGWQRRYYDHIIRSEHSLDQIRGYIIQNPARWELDQLFVEPFG